MPMRAAFCGQAAAFLAPSFLIAIAAFALRIRITRACYARGGPPGLVPVPPQVGQLFPAGMRPEPWHVGQSGMPGGVLMWVAF
jgi:hypothetical protein